MMALIPLREGQLKALMQTTTPGEGVAGQNAARLDDVERQEEEQGEQEGAEVLEAEEDQEDQEKEGGVEALQTAPPDHQQQHPQHDLLGCCLALARTAVITTMMLQLSLMLPVCCVRTAPAKQCRAATCWAVRPPLPRHLLSLLHSPRGRWWTLGIMWALRPVAGRGASWAPAAATVVGSMRWTRQWV